MEQIQRHVDLYEIPGAIPGNVTSLPAPPSVARPRLVQQIDDGISGRLVLITAPAGWGKSNVLADWANQTTLDVIWVNCESIGDSVSRFMRTVVAAAERIRPDFGRDLFAMLRSPRPLPSEHMFAILADSLREYDAEFALVLDDVHLIDEPEIVEGLYRLVTSGPDNLHIIIAGRNVPVWPFARWRVNGVITEIGIRDLAFSSDEAATLLGLNGQAEQVVEALRIRAEGWAAGLRLAKLWLGRLGNPSSLEDIFRGSHRDIADYLAEEVISQLPAETEQFLLTTSVLDRFSAPLAGAVSGIEDAARILEDIERQEMFLIPLDHEREWYRYHGVFREFLRARLNRMYPGREPELLTRAAVWCESQDEFTDAASYYMLAANHDAAAALVDRTAESLLLRQGETLTLINLVEQLPADIIKRYPALQRYFAWALVLVGRLEEAGALATEFEQSLEPTDEDVYEFKRAEIASIRSRIAAYEGDHDATIAYATIALQCAHPAMDWFRADALLSLGFAYRAIGKIDDACDVFGRAARLGWNTGFAHAALWGSRYQALTQISQGRLRDADALIETDVERARRLGLEAGSPYAALLVTRGELRYERNDLSGARSDLSQALALAREVGDAKILMNVYTALAVLEDAEGRADLAREKVRRAISIFDGSGEKALDAWLALRHGDISAVRRWMDTYIALEGDKAAFSCGEQEQVMLGRALLRVEDPARGQAFLEDLLRESITTGRWGRALSLQVLLAVAADEAGDEAQAFQYVRGVLDLALREQYVRSVLDEGTAFLRIMRRAVRHDDSLPRRQHAATLLAAADQASSTPSLDQTALAEPLTSRQEEVLQLIADGRSNREIADALFVAEGTVKAHVHQIFSKLMVRNRAEAIRAAQRITRRT